MRFLRTGPAAVALLAAISLTACGSSTHASTAAQPTTPAPTASAPTSTGSGAAADVATITKNWEAFFNAATPTAQRVALLQNGSAFASVIQGQAGSGLASAATAKVSAVTVTSPTQATVTYAILLAGTPALTGQTGTAIKDDGQWKVSDSSFCALLTLENGGGTSGLPAACPSGK
jgi:hypothetical protein